MYSVTAKNGKKEKSFMLDTDTPTVCFKSILVLQTAYSNHMYWLFFFLFFFFLPFPLRNKFEHFTKGTVGSAFDFVAFL